MKVEVEASAQHVKVEAETSAVPSLLDRPEARKARLLFALQLGGGGGGAAEPPEPHEPRQQEGTKGPESQAEHPAQRLVSPQFKIGGNVICRDGGRSWAPGVVTQKDPLLVRKRRWIESFPWEEVKPLTSFTTRQAGYECNHCGQSRRKNSKMMGNTEEDYHVCGNCHRFLDNVNMGCNRKGDWIYVPLLREHPSGYLAARAAADRARKAS